MPADGNEMSAVGAIFAGCEFFGGLSDHAVLRDLAPAQRRDLEMRWQPQAEDEIAGIGAVVGASFAGKKALTATSGPGRCRSRPRCSVWPPSRSSAGVRERAAR
ncbi:MAG: hypothetical protein IPK07_03200 [Deltaproteobacteria bacterium]|nr:hypothetical protein [Deltaproteobacteria bacterium]